MSKYDKSDIQVDGQLNLYDLYGPQEGAFAIHRIFARARREMSLAEVKTFVMALSEFRYTEKPKSPIVYLDKKTLADIVGVNSDPDHLSINLHRLICNLPQHSFVQIADCDKDLYDNGMVVTRLTMFRNRVRIKFEEEYLDLFTNLQNDNPDYLRMWNADIYLMQSLRSVQFYEYLRQITDTRQSVNDVLLGVKALKEMFQIPKDGKGSYMRGGQGFDRAQFEARVIEPLCQDLQQCKMITLIMQPDGKYYEKVKQGKRVSGYRFYWTYSASPSVADAKQVKQIQERVDKNPEILKVAKDLVNGAGKPKKKNSFNNFKQREYDYDEMERKLLADQMDQIEGQMSIFDYQGGGDK